MRSIINLLKHMDTKAFGITLMLVIISVTVLFLAFKFMNKDENAGLYTSIDSAQLSSMLENKDFILIDVHTPEQRHIPKTDYMVASTKIDKITSVLPDKNTKVVVYCRSGSMSKFAAQELVRLGYTNVHELDNGFNEWLLQNRETLPKGSVSAL